MHDKPTLRQQMRERLRAIDSTTHAGASAQIAAHLLDHLGAHTPGITLTLFGGLKNEPDFLPRVLPALIERGARPCLFAIDGNELHPRLISHMDDLQRGQMNVWEPRSHCPLVDIATLDLILVPGLAFARDGARLGRGGGYYDRLLAHPQCRARRVAIAFDLQIIDHIPTEPHDQRVHHIITEVGHIPAQAH